MHEPRLALHPLLDPSPAAHARVTSPWSRTALGVSILAHLLGALAVSRMSWTPDVLERAPVAGFVIVRPPPVAPPRAEVVVPPAPPAEAEVAEPPPAPVETVPPRAAEPPVPAPRAVLVPAVPVEPVLAPAPPASLTRLELEEARQRGAADAVNALAAESEYLTFSMDDVAPPREAAPERKPSIFDGTGASRRNATTVGQQRTRVGRRVAELCNALTGGFSIMGMGSFCARADDEPSGLFPEVRPEILDLMPECVETRPLAEALGEESPFSTVKCRLVPKTEIDPIPR